MGNLALSFDKIGCGSAEKTNKFVLFLRSPCTIFAAKINALTNIRYFYCNRNHFKDGIFIGDRE